MGYVCAVPEGNAIAIASSCHLAPACLWLCHSVAETESASCCNSGALRHALVAANESVSHGLVSGHGPDLCRHPDAAVEMRSMKASDVGLEWRHRLGIANEMGSWNSCVLACDGEASEKLRPSVWNCDLEVGRGSCLRSEDCESESHETSRMSS